MLISVLLPVKNAEKTIKSAVNSILGQKGVELELVIINDHSIDNTVSVINTISDSRIIQQTNKGSGIAAALNTGLAKAKGSYIARMDADDISAPNRLYTQLKYAHQNPNVDVISCCVEYTSDKNSKVGYKLYVDWINNILTCEEHFVKRFTDAPIAHPTLFCKKSVFDKFGNYSTDDVPEDFELWLRWMNQGVKFEKVKQVLYSWTDYPERASRTHPNYSIAAFQKVKSFYFANWIKSQEAKDVYICGYGSEVFQKVMFLEKAGVKIAGFVDLKAKPNASRKVITYSEVTRDKSTIFLSYIGDRNGKKKLRLFFNSKEMIEGEHYFFMA